jgi:hypothetical protein
VRLSRAQDVVGYAAVPAKVRRTVGFGLYFYTSLPTLRTHYSAASGKPSGRASLLQSQWQPAEFTRKLASRVLVGRTRACQQERRSDILVEHVHFQDPAARPQRILAGDQHPRPLTRVDRICLCAGLAHPHIDIFIRGA